MIINQNILLVLRSFSNLKKKNNKNFYAKEKALKNATTKRFSKISEKKENI